MSNEELALDPGPGVSAIERVPSVPKMMEAFLERGVTADNVAAFEKLIELHERMEARNGEREFAKAFAALQAEMPIVEAKKPVHTKDGTLKYKFAPYEAIMEQVRPLIQRHGFTLSFSMDFKEGRIIQTCTLTHIGGHSRSNQFMARIGSGPPGSSEAQADGAASTYAKRFALCNALNIVCEVDTDGADARNEGKPITEDQAIYLREQVKETKSNEADFLRFAGSATYEAIGSARYPSLIAALEKKRKS